MDTILHRNGCITKTALERILDLETTVQAGAEAEKELKLIRGVIVAALQEGAKTPDGYRIAIRESSRVCPAWKAIAVALGADEVKIRAETPPTISFTPAVERVATSHRMQAQG